MEILMERYWYSCLEILKRVSAIIAWKNYGTELVFMLTHLSRQSDAKNAEQKGGSMSDWLNERRKGIGGSDAAAICGVSPYRTPLQVWKDKRGRRAGIWIAEQPCQLKTEQEDTR